MNCPTSLVCKFCKVKQCPYCPDFKEPEFIEEDEKEDWFNEMLLQADVRRKELKETF